MEEVDDMAEKTYNASEAGSFPNRVRVFEATVGKKTKGYLAVTFNESTKLAVYSLSGDTIQEVAMFDVAASPLDFACQAGCELTLLLPAPHHVQAVKLSVDKTGKWAMTDTSTSTSVVEHCTELGVDFTTQLTSQAGVDSNPNSTNESNHKKGNRIKGKHEIKRKFSQMMRGEPGELVKKTWRK